MKLPSQFHCIEPNDFIGPARAAAHHVATFARQARASQAPVRFAFLGAPGCGKSDLAAFLASCLGANQFTTYLKNGASFRIEDVEEWNRTLHLREMWADYRVFRIEEVDRASTPAQVALLTLLDSLPPGNAFIVTTNKTLKELEPRFARRFQKLPGSDERPNELLPPSVEEIAAFLTARFRLLPRVADAIARESVLDMGYVGQALQAADAAVAYPHNLLPPEPPRGTARVASNQPSLLPA